MARLLYHCSNIYLTYNIADGVFYSKVAVGNTGRFLGQSISSMLRDPHYFCEIMSSECLHAIPAT